MYKTDKWELKYFKDEDKIEIVVHEDDGRITNGFAEIPCYGEAVFSSDDQWEIARLLVAAPKLLAACENLARGQLQHPTFEDYVKHAVAVAKDAIKAAKPKTFER